VAGALLEIVWQLGIRIIEICQEAKYVPGPHYGRSVGPMGFPPGEGLVLLVLSKQAIQLAAVLLE
jgi:hypothetical protein